MIRILTFTTLYPSSARPHHGIFVEQRLRRVIETGKVCSSVIAPVPWFPLRSGFFGEYASFAGTPSCETRHGIEILHPRFPLIPRFGMSLAPFLLAARMLPYIKKWIRDGHDFDVLDAHYFYPDGVAAVWIAEKLNKPVVVTARGTDINLIPEYALPRKLILNAAQKSHAIVTVCQALKDQLVGMGAGPDKIHVLRNGVDLDLFKSVDRQRVREKLNLKGRILLSVGLLVERKGHHIAIAALKDLPDVCLIIAGDGEMRNELESLARSLGVMERVRFVGALAHEELKFYYSAADALVLASSREGMANVLLESLACGTPVIATALWGTPEVVATPEAGELMQERNAVSLVSAANRLFEREIDRAATRRYAENFSWDRTTAGQLDLFRSLAGSGMHSV
jgi:glycosyltransferase involved in cell wall biosynthesis